MSQSLKRKLLITTAVYLLGSFFNLSLAQAEENDGLAKVVKKTVRDPVTNEISVECSIRTPDQVHSSPPIYGLSKVQLLQMAQVSKYDQALVQWYLGGLDNYNQIAHPAPGSKDALIRRATNWFRCESMGKFVNAANRDFFQTPAAAPSAKMLCKNARFNFAFETIDGRVQLEMSWTKPAKVVPARFTRGTTVAPATEEKRSMVRENVQVVRTGEAACPLRVTQVTQNAKALQICLPLRPQNANSDGTVNMHLAGHELPINQRSISCVGDSHFAQLATHAAQDGQSQFADASASAPDSGSLADSVILR